MIYLEDYYSIHHCVNCNSELKQTVSDYNKMYYKGSCNVCLAYSISWIDDDGIDIGEVRVRCGSYQEARIKYTCTKFITYTAYGAIQESIEIDEIMQVNKDNFKHQLDRAKKLKVFE